MKKKAKKRKPAATKTELRALLACPSLRGKTCQASSDRIDASTFAAQEGLALGHAAVGGARTGYADGGPIIGMARPAADH